MKFTKEQAKRVKSFSKAYEGLLKKYDILPVLTVYNEPNEEGIMTIESDIMYLPKESIEKYQTELLDEQAQEVNEIYS